MTTEMFLGSLMVLLMVVGVVVAMTSAGGLGQTLAGWKKSGKRIMRGHWFG